MLSTRPTRTRLLALAVVGVVGTSLLAACGGDGDAATPQGLQKVTVTTPPGFYNSLPFELARERGAFAKHGVEVEVIDVTNGGTMITSVVSGSADVGMNMSPPLIGIAVDGGQEVRYFCGNSKKFYADLLVRPDSDLPTVAEAGSLKAVFEAMKGKKVGVITVGGNGDLVIQGAVREAGVDPKTIDFVSVGSGPSAVTAFESGQVDVLHGYPFITQQLVSAGSAKMLVDLQKESPLVGDFYAAGFFAMKSWIEENPKVAKAVCDAYGEGIEMMKDPANEEAVNTLLRDNFNLTTDESLALARKEVASTVTTEISKDGLNHTFEAAREVGAMPKGVDVDYDDTVLLPADD